MTVISVITAIFIPPFTAVLLALVIAWFADVLADAVRGIWKP